MSKVQWIKIDTDILHNRKIMALRFEKNGNQIILLWIFLLVLAGQTNDQGNLYFTPTIPYDQEKLSKELYIQKPIIAAGLDYFQKNEMIKIKENGWISIENWEEYQNYEQLERIKEGNRQRQKRYYEKHKTNENLTPPVMLANATDKSRLEENRKEENRLDFFTGVNDKKFIETLDKEPQGILYDKFTDELLKENLITSVDATTYHKEIESYFTKFESHFKSYLKSFQEKRVNGKYILKMIGVIK